MYKILNDGSLRFESKFNRQGDEKYLFGDLNEIRIEFDQEKSSPTANNQLKCSIPDA
jgi:hypothetical protein